MEKRSRHSPLGSDTLNQKAWTFFFSNFPDMETECSMWKTFACLGVIVDLYIARKKSKWGKRFGFVRFIKVANWKALENDLNSIWIGNFRIRANLARFNRIAHKNHGDQAGVLNRSLAVSNGNLQPRNITSGADLLLKW
ncbi:hypothetical protein OSB04_012448 [Centaurea solstitialis]|uniref:RRM domain-containing protein n=1 Tax=Centaurea solstitialis TaxID=347529 RepID=A0AA38TBD5_9ASTR|nr:hypothetical protein OSB04_012448 [Centaurea solstitialis]